MTDGIVRVVAMLHVALLVAVLGGLAAGGFDPRTTDLGPWWSGFVTVNLGLAAANAIMMMLARRPSESRLVAAEMRRQDLEDNRAIVIEALRQLDAERQKVSPEDYARERAELLAIGTAASRELAEGAWLSADDDVGSSPATVVAATSPGTAPSGSYSSVEALARRLAQERALDPELFDAALQRAGLQGTPGGEWRGAFATLVLVGILALIGWGVSSDARDRGPGGSMTGGESVGGAPMEAPPRSSREQALEARLAAAPNDLGALNDLTEAALAREDQAAALAYNQRALAVSPDDPDARVFRAVLLAFVDQLPRAFEELDAVLAAHADNVRALVYRGLLSLRQDPSRAVEVLTRAAALDASPQVQALLEEARRRAAGAPAAVSPEAPVSSAPPELLVEGRIELGVPGATGQRVFVSVRDPRGGPPLAAIDLPPGPFPLAFRITSANRVAMMGGTGPLPERVVVVARLDSDGDAMSRPPSDPSATARDVALGSEGLTLDLVRSGP